jgi:anti-sigma factor RsiW
MRLRESICKGAPYYKAPVDLAQQIRSRLAMAETAARPQTSRRLPFRAFAAAAAVVLMAGLTLVIIQASRSSTSDALSRELVSAHVRSTLADHLLDVVSSDQHTVKPWFAGKLDFSLPVQDLQSAGFPLQGGRLDYLAGRPVAALVYRHNKHVINCFVWPENSPQESSSTTTLQGYSLLQFNQQGLIWHLVSDASMETLQQLARELKSNATTQWSIKEH